MFIVNQIHKKAVNDCQSAMSMCEIARFETRKEAEEFVARRIDEICFSSFYFEQRVKEHETLSCETDCKTFITIFQSDYYPDENMSEEIRETYLFQFRNIDMLDVTEDLELSIVKYRDAWVKPHVIEKEVK